MTNPGPAAAAPSLLSSPLLSSPRAAGCCKRRLAGAHHFRPEKSRSRRFPLEAGFVFPGTALTRTEAAISARSSAGGQLQALERGFSGAALGSCWERAWITARS